jgi:hypothetical protein
LQPSYVRNLVVSGMFGNTICTYYARKTRTNFWLKWSLTNGYIWFVANYFMDNLDTERKGWLSKSVFTKRNRFAWIMMLVVSCSINNDFICQDMNGDGALHLAASANHVDTANALLHLGSFLFIFYILRPTTHDDFDRKVTLNVLYYCIVGRFCKSYFNVRFVKNFVVYEEKHFGITELR